ncbi:TPA: Hsp20/alpha crystallin family protein [bacterium]|nr:Hsp20/alpha crystallin family protein [bacterium]
MRLTFWDPFREMAMMQKALDSAFGTPRITYPPIEVTDKDEIITVKAILPGVDKSTLDLTVLGDSLTISGEKNPSITEGITYIRRERPYGKFRKLVDLPYNVDQDKITATYSNGILTVTLPKAESAKPRQIAVE